MKKLLLSLIALLGITTYAVAQVTETDRSTYNDVMYVQSAEILKGSAVDITINAKAHQNFTAFELSLVLPAGATVKDLNGIEQSRKQYVETKGSDVYEFNKMEDGSYKIVGTATCDRGFRSGDAALGYITINVSGLEDGEYPFIVKNVTFSGFMNPETGAATGEADVTVAAEITTKVEITSFVTLDEESTAAPSALNDVNVKVKRTINKDEWSTICLPFAMTEAQVKNAFGNDVKLGDFKGCETTTDDEENIVGINVKFDAATEIEANHPYIIKTTKPVSEFIVENVNIAPESEPSVDCDEVGVKVGKIMVYSYNSFKGTYVANTEVPNLCLFLNNNKFWYSTGKTKMQAYRGYFDFYDIITEAEDTYSEAKVYINFGGETTYINTLPFKNNGNANIFSIDGKKMGNDMNKLNRGIYIQNSRKVVK